MAQDLVKSAARAFEIMEAFASERRRLTASQLGAMLGYPKSSMNVLLKSLMTQGYLAYETGDASYFPTLKLTHLGDWVPSTLFGSNLLLPMLEALRNSTDETVTLTMATGLHMRCLRVLIGRHPIALQLDEGLLFSIFGTAVGHAYLATLADTAIAALLQRRNAQLPRSKQMALADIMSDVSQVRARGCSVAFERVVPDTGAVAVPLRSSHFGETLVVAVAGLDSRIAKNEDRIIRELKRLTKNVEQTLSAEAEAKAAE